MELTAASVCGVQFKPCLTKSDKYSGIIWQIFWQDFFFTCRTQKLQSYPNLRMLEKKGNRVWNYQTPMKLPNAMVMASVQKPAPEKLPNVAFWRPQERWRRPTPMPDITRQAASKAWKKPCKNHVVDGAACGWSCNGTFGGSSRSRNSQTPAGFKPNLSKNQPPKKCLTSPSDAPTTSHRVRRNRDRNMATSVAALASVGLNSKVPRAPFVMHAKQRHPSRIQTSLSNAL